ncbi:MAG: DUF5662 family protein [Phycisphaerales bacterium]
MSTEVRDDVMRETVKHVRRVGNLMLEAIGLLQVRAVNHDDSKFSKEEFELFVQETPNLRNLTYGSEEYKAALGRLHPALSHHYCLNRHHPEYFATTDDGRIFEDQVSSGEAFGDMNLLDLLEMLADWKAATERHNDGNLIRSIEQNAERFGYDESMKRLLKNTAQYMGWV